MDERWPDEAAGEQHMIKWDEKPEAERVFRSLVEEIDLIGFMRDWTPDA